VIRAVLFDFGGTLYDYANLVPGDQESLASLCEWAGVSAEPAHIRGAYRDSIRRVFHSYLPRSYYLHRDLFRDAAAGMLEQLGVPARAEDLDRYRAMQWDRHRRDFVLRDGVDETLRALRERGLRVGLVSNIDEDQLAHLLEIAGIADSLDFHISSERALSCKPHGAIFEQALKLAGCDSQEALFVGDTLQQDVEGANRAGLVSVLIWHRSDREPPADGPRPHYVISSIPQVLELL
jgi:HAD superfamily hydrolase (TIGR01509 family)